MQIDISPGDVIREYRFERPIGGGAHGMVWQARHRLFEACVAIKVIDVRDLDPQDVERVKRECQIGRRLAHQKNIVEVRTAFEENQRLFIEMELADGGSLAGYLRQCPCPPLDLTLRWARDLCATLEEVHDMGIIHRDIKPQNILLIDDEHVKLGDFGVAHLAKSSLTTSFQPGTPAYRAPEQEANQAVDSRVDVYALCAVFFEVWSGRKWFHFRGPDPEIAREELELSLEERYGLSMPTREGLADVLLAGLRPRAARAALKDLKAGLCSMDNDCNWAWQKERESAHRIEIGKERYLRGLANAYRAYVRDRFVHQAMDAVQATPAAKVDALPSDDLCDDPLMVELFALTDEEAEGEPDTASDIGEVETRPVGNLRDGLAAYRTVALLGAPGAGKTWALLWLLGTWQGFEEGVAHLPVFVSLSRYDQGPFEDFLVDAWAPSLVDTLRADEEQRNGLEMTIRPLASRLREYIAEGHAVLVMDALNELPQGADRQERLDRLRNFVHEAIELGNWVIIGCRQRDYTEGFQRMQRVEIRPLDDARIRRFLEAYLGAPQGDELWSILRKPRYGRLHELIRNPFLLYGLVGIRLREGGELPTMRAALLSRLAMLSMRWERGKGHRNWVSPGEQEKVLGALAVAMTTLGKTIVTKAELADRIPDAWFFEPGRQEPLLPRVLRLAQGARLARSSVAKDAGTISFEHQVWQEYYAARLLASMSDPEWRGLARYAAGQDDAREPQDILQTQLHNPSWRNVVLMTASQLDTPGTSKFVSGILEANSLWEKYLNRDARLAAACLTEGARVDSQVVDRVLNALGQARDLGIQPLIQRIDRARVDLLIAQDRFEELIALTQDSVIWWETRLQIIEKMLQMGRQEEVVEALVRTVRNTQLHRKTRREAAERLEEMNRTEAAIEAWALLERDSRVGKGIQRIARRALRRLR